MRAVFNCLMVSSRIAISSRKSSFLRSNNFILPLPKRELTPLARTVAALVAYFFLIKILIILPRNISPIGG